MSAPERLGKYQITGVLGEGAMGVVYRGLDPDIRRVVALKTVRRQPGEDAQSAAHSAARFRNEAQAAGRLMHPGIVGVYDFGDDGRVAYIAMEFVEGHTLAHYLAHRVQFSESDVASVAVQLLDALGHAHEHGVWHRDIKPSNVIVTRTGRLKVADFGIARIENSTLTMANSVLGTPMYMAPEQFMGRPVDHRVDVYGAGVVLYQLLAGRTPFSGPSEALMYKVVNEQPLPPSLVDGAPHGPRFDEAVLRALAKDAGRRHPTAAAFRDAVLAAFGGPAAATVAAEVVNSMPPPTEFAPTQRIEPLASQGSSTGDGMPTNWDPAVLSQVETSLARHVGPLASLLVRRAARECADLPQLQARLAEQITNAASRDAFLGRTGSTTNGSSTPGRSTFGFDPTLIYAPPPTTGSGSGSTGAAAVSDGWLEQAQRVAATQLGPIARVVVKRAAERTRQRDALCELIAQAAPEAARAALLAELLKLR